MKNIKLPDGSEIVVKYIGEPQPKVRRFTARSRSRLGTLHELVAHSDGRVLSCSCLGFSFGHRCYHADRLAEFLADFEERSLGDPCSLPGKGGDPRRGVPSVCAT